MNDTERDDLLRRLVEASEAGLQARLEPEDLAALERQAASIDRNNELREADAKERADYNAKVFAEWASQQAHREWTQRFWLEQRRVDVASRYMAARREHLSDAALLAGESVAYADALLAGLERKP